MKRIFLIIVLVCAGISCKISGEPLLPVINIGGNNTKISGELKSAETVIIRGVGIPAGKYSYKDLLKVAVEVGLKKSALHNKNMINYVKTNCDNKQTFIVVDDQYMHSTVRNYQRSISDYRRLDDKVGYHSFAVANAMSQTGLKDLIYVHLGSGISITGIIEGVSVCTSMGVEANSGLWMERRDGDTPSGYKQAKAEGLVSLGYKDFRDLYSQNDRKATEIKKLFLANIVKGIGEIEAGRNLEYFFREAKFPTEKCPIVVGGGIAKCKELMFCLTRFYYDRKVIIIENLDEETEMRKVAKKIIERK